VLVPDFRAVPWPVAYIAVLRCSEETEEKINSKHHVALDQVREAVVLTPVRSSGWDLDPVRGARLLVAGTTYEGHVLNVVLYPVDEDEGIWDLGTAMREWES